MSIFVFRVDMSPAIGGGHFFRCYALAQALIAAEQSVIFIVNEKNPAITAALEKSEIPCLYTGCAVLTPNDWLQDVRICIELLAEWSSICWLIVDHYQLGAAWEGAMKSHLNCSVLAIDDLANRSHVSDILLDYNAYSLAQQNKYSLLITSQCKVLFGQQYVLLRKEFYLRRTSCLFVPQWPPARILLFFGATDPAKISSIALKALALRPNYYFDLILGALCPEREEIISNAHSLPHVVVSVQPENFVELLSTSDAVICAGGTALWELFCLGHYPSVVIVAENQQEICQQFAQAGYIKLLGEANQVNVSTFCNALDNLTALSREYVEAKRHHCYDFVDGLGCERVVMHLVS